MRSKLVLVDEQTFKDLSPAVGQLDYAFITPSLIEAQDVGLPEIIGERLLSDIYVQLEDCQVCGTYEKLIEDYIQPYLVHEALARGLNYMLFKLENSGVVKRNSENGTAAELVETSFLADREKTVAASYGMRLRRYLEANADLYPLFKEEFKGEISPKTTPNFTGGMWLGNTFTDLIIENNKPEPPREMPVADFYSDDRAIFTDTTASFNFIGSDNAMSYQWSFGDGTMSAEKNPTHEYTAAGTYSVSLKVTNTTGFDITTKDDYIVVTDQIP
jgi:hypothetical protein